jgi:hypothetical protein
LRRYWKREISRVMRAMRMSLIARSACADRIGAERISLLRIA